MSLPFRCRSREGDRVKTALDHPKAGRGRPLPAGDGAAPLELTDGSRVGVVGGGPAGSFFSFFLLAMADSIGLEVTVDVYEPRFFAHRGPAGCNHCGGIISESLVQMLAAEGINLPPTVVQQGIDSYVLHTDQGDVRIQAPLDEKRIAAVYRGNGPRESEPIEVAGFDRHLLDLASSSGARVVRKLARSISWEGGLPRVTSVDGTALASTDEALLSAKCYMVGIDIFPGGCGSDDLYVLRYLCYQAGRGWYYTNYWYCQ